MRSQVTRKDATARDRVAVRGLQRAITGITIRASGAPNSGRENWSNLISPRKSVAFQDPARRGRLRCVQEEEREGTKSRGKTNSFTGRCVYTSIQAWRDAAKKEEKERNIFVIWISRRPYTARGAEKERERERGRKREGEKGAVSSCTPKFRGWKGLLGRHFPPSLSLSSSLFLSFLAAARSLSPSSSWLAPERLRAASESGRARRLLCVPASSRSVLLTRVKSTWVAARDLFLSLSFSLPPSHVGSAASLCSAWCGWYEKSVRARERAENPSFSFHLPKIPARFGHIGARKKAAAGSAAASAL